jgi:hypothetical protein
MNASKPGAKRAGRPGWPSLARLNRLPGSVYPNESMIAAQPYPAPSATPGPTVLVERPPPGLARGPFEGSVTLVLTLGLLSGALGLGYLVWCVVRWGRRRVRRRSEY